MKMKILVSLSKDSTNSLGLKELKEYKTSILKEGLKNHPKLQDAISAINPDI